MMSTPSGIPNPDPLLLDIPQQLETERLLLCAPQASLSTIINPAINDSLENLRKWFAWAQKPHTLQETERSLRQAVVRFHSREDMHFYLFKKEDGDFVGRVGLKPLDWQVPSFSIAFWVNRKFEGKGFMTEAVKGITHFALSVCHANRLEITCDARNHRSAAVAERAGFVYEGTLHWNRRDVEGRLCDTLVYVKFS
jgi:RimJ/RimL family protein N-acetyltransferase